MYVSYLKVFFTERFKTAKCWWARLSYTANPQYYSKKQNFASDAQKSANVFLSSGSKIWSDMSEYNESGHMKVAFWMTEFVIFVTVANF